MSKAYIIIVEDDANLGKIYKMSLQKAGYEVALDADGSTFLSLLAQRPADLLILDMHVPFAWGPDSIAKLKSQPETANIKRLITTADIYVAKEMKQAGETVLTKPVGVTRLLETVQALLADE